MKKQKFNDLLVKYMRQKNITVEQMLEGIISKGQKLSKTTLINWRTGKHKPRNNPHGANHRDIVLVCANILRLSKKETNDVLEAAGFEPEEDDFVKNLFLELPRYRTMLLLTQADWQEPPYHEISTMLLDYAQKIYGKPNVLHITLPVALNIDTRKYFTKLGKQCNFQEVEDDQSFEFALETRLDQTEPLFLLVSRFEQGAEAPREQLASIIKALSAVHFHVLLCGGEKLADLKYQNGDMSLLNHAEVRYWSELSYSDVYALSHYYDVPLENDKLAKHFLTISGANPKLLGECLILKKQSPDFPLEKYPEKLSKSSYVYGLFTPLTQDQSTRQKMRHWIQMDEVGKAEPYIQDNILRKLYWKNLLVKRGECLYWRCEAMRMAGKTIFGNEKKASSQVQYFVSN
jgi:hypothetical protein